MKKLYALATLALLFSACSKDPAPATANDPVATFKFTGNGILYEMNGSLATSSSLGSIIWREGDINTGQYYLKAENGVGFHAISMPLSIGAVVATKYTFTYPNGGCAFVLNSIGYYSKNAGDNSTVTISSIHDGVYADGTFSAQLTKNTGTAETLVITNGEFKNVKILL